MRRIIDILVNQIKYDDLGAVGVNANMKLSPSARFGRAVPFKQPFILSYQPLSGAVDDQVKPAHSSSPVGLNRHSTRPPTKRRTIGDWQIDPQHLHGRANQAFALLIPIDVATIKELFLRAFGSAPTYLIEDIGLNRSAVFWRVGLSWSTERGARAPRTFPLLLR